MEAHGREKSVSEEKDGGYWQLLFTEETCILVKTGVFSALLPFVQRGGKIQNCGLPAGAARVCSAREYRQVQEPEGTAVS